MANDTNFLAKTFIEAHEELTAEERKALHKLNAGYGHFIHNARIVGLHPNTFRGILARGRGRARYVRKIKANLLGISYEDSIHR